MMSTDVAQRESASPRQLGLDGDSRWLDNEVLLLEKAPELGGTANKAAFWYWVPNNERMHELGLQDDEASFLRYCARLSVPHAYDPHSPTLGMAQWEYDACRAIYESASPARR
jgi:3-oxosteroid 1-dehydrogenase